VNFFFKYIFYISHPIWLKFGAGYFHKNLLSNFDLYGSQHSKKHYFPIFVGVMSGFSRELDEICALLGYYATYNSNSLPTFWDTGPILKGRDSYWIS